MKYPQDTYEISPGQRSNIFRTTIKNPQDTHQKCLIIVLELFGACHGNNCWVFWRYFMGFLEIFDVCPGDI